MARRRDIAVSALNSFVQMLIGQLLEVWWHNGIRRAVDVNALNSFVQMLIGQLLEVWCHNGTQTWCCSKCFKFVCIQVGRDNSDANNSDSAITRALFGLRDRVCRLKCVLITQILL